MVLGIGVKCGLVWIGPFSDCFMCMLPIPASLYSAEAQYGEVHDVCVGVTGIVGHAGLQE